MCILVFECKRRISVRLNNQFEIIFVLIFDISNFNLVPFDFVKTCRAIFLKTTKNFLAKVISIPFWFLKLNHFCDIKNATVPKNGFFQCQIAMPVGN